MALPSAAGTPRTDDGWAAAFTTAFEQFVTDRELLTAGRALLASGALERPTVHASLASTRISLPTSTSVIRPTLSTPTLTPTQWQQAATALAGTKLAEEVLDGRLPAPLADPSRTGGVPLLPQADQLTVNCTCPSAGRCAHTAALGYALAEHAKTTPGVLLTYRGRTQRRFRTQVRLAAHALVPGALEPPSAPSTTEPSAPPPAAAEHPAGQPPVAVDSITGEATAGVPAQQVFDNWAANGHRPPPKLAPPVRRPLLTELDEPPSPAPPAPALRLLAEDAAARAAALLDDPAAPPGEHGDPLIDAVRLLATYDTGLPADAATEAAGRFHLTGRQLRHLIVAFQHGGPEGAYVTAYDQPTDPDVLAAAEQAIQPLRPAPTAPLERDHHRLTDAAARVQLRHSPSGHWYPYTFWLEDWQPVPGHAPNPATSYKAALRARR